MSYECQFSFLVIKIIKQDATKEIKYIMTIIPNQSLQVMNREELYSWKAPHLFMYCIMRVISLSYGEDDQFVHVNNFATFTMSIFNGL